MNLLLSAMFFAACFFLPSVPAAADPVASAKYNNNPVVATVDGKPVMLDDLKNAKMHDAMLQLHQMQKHNLKQKAVKLLLVEHPELKKELVSKVTPGDVFHFYKSTPGISEMGSFKKMKDEIHDYLVRMYEQTYIEKIYKRAVSKGWIEDYLKAPNDFTVVTSLGSAMLWFDETKPPARKVFVLEYSDFQCPFCKLVQGTLSKLRVRFADNVQFGYRHFPLPIHKEAHKLAEAVECAREQNRFWQLQSVIYKNAPRNLNKAYILKLARKVGISNLDDFETCWSEGKYKDRVFADWEEGNQIGVQATPTFVVGIYDSKSATVSGEMFSGAVSEDKFVRMIEKYLSLSRAAPKG
ncbi:MAG: DsbA family protein [Nitrospinales bacterium]